MPVRFRKIAFLYAVVGVILCSASTAHASQARSQHRSLAAYIIEVNPGLSSATAASYAKAVIQAANEYTLPPEHLVAMMKVESTYNKKAHSSAGAIGLMQINPRVWCNPKNPDSLLNKGIIQSKADLWHPVKNIWAGAFILRHYLDKAKSSRVKNPMKTALFRYSGKSRVYPKAIRSAVKHYDAFKAALAANNS